MAVRFVFTPTSPYTSQEADKLVQWVRDSGGLLIYASEQGDPELDRALGVVRSGGTISTGGPYTAAPTLSGVASVSGGGESHVLDPSASQVPILRTRAHFVAGYEERLGIGQVVVLSDPLVEVATPEGKATGLAQDSLVTCLQLATMSEDRITTVIGKLSPAMLSKVSDCLKATLDIP